MKKYKVLWFDDEHANFQSIKDEAVLENVQLIGYSNASEGIDELKNNYKHYDAIILDGLFFKTADHQGSNIDDSAFGEVAKFITELKAQNKILPWFIYSGQPSFVKDKNSFVELFKDNSFAAGKVFDKSKDEDFTELLNEIKKNADVNPERIIKVQNAEIFSIFEEGILSEDVEDQLLSIFKKPFYINKPELKGILTNIRSIQESIFLKLEGIKVLPNGLSFSQKNTHLSGNKTHASGWVATSLVFQTAEIETLQKWVYITCGTFIHHLDKVQYTGELISNYAVQSMFSGLLELLLWFKKTYKENI
ncbi:hypothetical protein [Chryseobacterium sp. 8AT]|uniref:hypothetical protein n=1 Tax=Chryseobacterium sp. 8AT TaxID=2653134 RepID=UPI0012F39674|nr:hypothetical protein [Chryseobacterium sp. 8AT]VXC57703.1 conserved hypothetical protein [Chryseobacterium sp. 8AT]